jgi:hypothetical protein
MPENQVFISYSHKDKVWMERFRASLRPFQRGEKVAVWADVDIEAGMQWQEKIRQAIAGAKVALLLVSMDFIDSDFVWDFEMPLIEEAEKERLTIVWVAVSPSGYKNTSLVNYQAGHDPERPLNAMTEPEWQAKIVGIAEKIAVAAGSARPIRKWEERDYQGTFSAGQLRYEKLDGPPPALMAESGPSLCDRTDQEQEFDNYLSSLTAGGGKDFPQFYTLHGNYRENHKGFVARLRDKNIPEHASRLYPEEKAAIKWLEFKEPRWPRVGDLSLRMKNLRNWVYEGFDPEAGAGHKGPVDAAGYTAAEFRERLVSSGFNLIIIQHELDAEHWDGKTARLLRSYLRFWDAVKADASLPLCLIFLNINYPAAPYGEAGSRWLRPAFYRQRLKKRLIKGRLGWLSFLRSGWPRKWAGQPRCPFVLLKELGCVRRIEVTQWLQDYMKIGDMKYWEEQCREIFSPPDRQPSECISMADLEHELRRVIEKHIRSLPLFRQHPRFDG